MGSSNANGLFRSVHVDWRTLWKALRRILCSDWSPLWFALAAPGVYSMAGAAAMLGGFTHMTLAITALLVEASKDLSLIPMLMLSISISHLVSTNISHHGYDEVLIHKKGVPFLEAELPHELEQGQLAIDLMDEYPDEAILPAEAPLEIVEQALAADVDVFPVVDQEGICLGTVSRSRLAAAVHAHKPADTKQVQVDDAVDKDVEVAVVITQLARRPSLTNNGVKIPAHRLMDSCPFTILEDMPAPRFYSMFALGSVEHAAVISQRGEFRGVMTRRNLISVSGHSHAKEIPMKRSSSPTRRSASGSPIKSLSPVKSERPMLLGNTSVRPSDDDMEKQLPV